ncbi:MAG: hypothetical protein QOG01_1084 [Pseudonocardiales bacterium]|jgi:hypothetical protein|nr:hypothetical protein [Pseudonocardiales bacterium]
MAKDLARTVSTGRSRLWITQSPVGSSGTVGIANPFGNRGQLVGYTTDMIGHIDVHPPLNQPEQLYLSAFRKSRRCRRPGGPYDAPYNPAADRVELSAETDDYNAVAVGQPSLWCGWTPCWDGCCLAHDGQEKFYSSTGWMAYLIDHFLAPGAHARRSGLDWFEDFTFDHTLNGIVACCRRDTRELYLIRVEQNAVREEVLWPADPRAADYGVLPYEAAFDQWNEGSRRRMQRRPSAKAPSAGVRTQTP